jgi:hypothetical protein
MLQRSRCWARFSTSGKRVSSPCCQGRWSALERSTVGWRPFGWRAGALDRRSNLSYNNTVLCDSQSGSSPWCDSTHALARKAQLPNWAKLFGFMSMPCGRDTGSNSLQGTGIIPSVALYDDRRAIRYGSVGRPMIYLQCRRQGNRVRHITVMLQL